MPNKTFTVGSVGSPVDINVTGTLTAPTPTSGSGNTQVATKGYVDSVISGVSSLPSQSGNNGKYLTTNGTTASWGTLDLSNYVQFTDYASVSKAGAVKVDIVYGTNINNNFSKQNQPVNPFVDINIGNNTTDINNNINKQNQPVNPFADINIGNNNTTNINNNINKQSQPVNPFEGMNLGNTTNIIGITINPKTILNPCNFIC